jgi:hypothetical protein
MREAETLAIRLNDQRRLAWVLVCKSAHLSGGHTGEMRSLAQKVEIIGEGLQDFALQVAAQDHLITAGYIAGDYRATEQRCRRLIQALEGDRIGDRFGLALLPSVLTRAYLARTLAQFGVFDEAESYGQNAIDLAEKLDHPFSLIFGYLALAWAYRRRCPPVPSMTSTH